MFKSLLKAATVVVDAPVSVAADVVTLGQGQITAPGQHAQNVQTRVVHATADQPLVPGRGNTVQDHARDVQLWHVGLEPQRRGRRRLRLSARVDH